MKFLWLWTIYECFIKTATGDCFQGQFIMIQCINQKLHWTMIYFYLFIFHTSHLPISLGEGLWALRLFQVRMLFQNLPRFQELWVRFFFWQFHHLCLHRTWKGVFLWVLLSSGTPCKGRPPNPSSSRYMFYVFRQIFVMWNGLAFELSTYHQLVWL